MKNFFQNNIITIKLFVVVIIFVFFIEFSLMYFLEIILDGANHFTESIVDAISLSIFISPILYFFVFRYLIKEIKIHKEVEKKYQDLFEYSEDAIMTLCPPDWKFFDGNSAALKIYGLKDNEELKKISPKDVSPEYQADGEPSSEKAKRMIELALEKGNNSFEWTHKKLNGPEFFAFVSLVKIVTDKNIYLRAVVRDISKEKIVTDKIIKSDEDVKKSLIMAERANKLMVGRELEMLKLKAEIIKLKEEK